jgi:peptide/nickel transport system permease protein
VNAVAQPELEPAPRRVGLGGHVAGFARTFPAGVLGVVLLLAFVALALASPSVEDAAYQNEPVERLTPPVWSEGGTSAHILGTDSLGRDLLARIMVAVRISLTVAAVSIAAAVFIGIVLGTLAGYLGGWLDDVLMRATDTMLAIPIILLAISVMAVLEPGIRTLVFVIAATQWMTFARVARAEVLALKQQQFVTAARAIGAPHTRIMLRHIVPQLLPSVIALGTLNVSVIILLEAGLSFLGLGVQPPDPSLGSLLSEGRQFIVAARHLAVYPGLALLLLVLSINLVGDGLRAYLDPRTRE